MSLAATIDQIVNDFLAGNPPVPQGWPAGLPASLLHANFGEVDQRERTAWNLERFDRSHQWLIRKNNMVAEIEVTECDQGKVLWWRQFSVEAYAKAYYRRRRRTIKRRLR